MKLIKVSLLILLLVFTVGSNVYAGTVVPPPIFKNIMIDATVSYDSSGNVYRYEYAALNPDTNSGDILSVEVNIERPKASVPYDTEEFTIPYGVSVRTFGDIYRSRINPVEMIPVGIVTPEGWWGSIAASGYAAFNCCAPPGRKNNQVLPGGALSGMVLLSRGVPTIRGVSVIPTWVYVSNTLGGITEAESEEASRLDGSVQFNTHSIGPSAVLIGHFRHWNQLRDDLVKAIDLGWIPDNALANSLQSLLAEARALLDADDGTAAKASMQAMLDALAQATPGQIDAGASDLVRLNVLALMQYTPDTPIAFEPVYSLTPKTASYNIGLEHGMVAKVINAADNDAPATGQLVRIVVTEGPHSGLEWAGFTDINGEFSIRYKGEKVGTDHIIWLASIIGGKELENPIRLAATTIQPGMLALAGDSPNAVAEAEVTWQGGPDLVVPFLMPLELTTQGGNPVFMTEITENIGSIEAFNSVTRYYISNVLPVDPAAAAVVGGRVVPPLLPKEVTDTSSLQYTIPEGLPEGEYYFAACADADNEIVELNEANNCSFNKLTHSTYKVVAVVEPSNNPPDCSQATASESTLWPPNHKLADITVNGITDPDGDPISVLITSIRQDEPVNGLGDGDTSPDGFGVNTSTAQVRVERSGLLNGRVYTIAFTADDGQGGVCDDAVSVGVPHDQGKGSVPINDGANYDSTLAI
ncbi:MAG: hypothetical protein BMS9Abin36_0752 [Gammaproteobacteria bacterium]|nr:MAG: hypothetical protein BMS9Abin36_0752 [Gammaproteobacteria bacterium]